MSVRSDILKYMHSLGYKYAYIWRKYASINEHNVGSENGLLPIHHQAETMIAYCHCRATKQSIIDSMVRKVNISIPHNIKWNGT